MMLKFLMRNVIFGAYLFTCILILDFFFGATALDLFEYKSNSRHRVKHSIFHHHFRSNVNLIDTWGDNKYKFCTDQNGFRNNCIKSNNSYFDLVIMGDSFTEGIGLDYENTFVGMLQKSFPNKKIANMGVSSYSPSIYFSKIKYYIDKGLKFNHVIVGIDISDIQDEAGSYVLKANGLIIDPGNSVLRYNLKRFIYKNFPLLYSLLAEVRKITNTKKTLSQNKVDIYDIDFKRSAWTWNTSIGGYGSMGVKGGINKSLKSMELLYNLLKKNNIQLSVLVYPWPGQILHDNVNSLQVKIWKKFCMNRCKYFINVFPEAFNKVKDTNIKKFIKDHFIDGDVHFNKLGNQMLFKKIKNKLDQEM
jgi:hypothetical protein